MEAALVIFCSFKLELGDARFTFTTAASNRMEHVLQEKNLSSDPLTVQTKAILYHLNVPHRKTNDRNAKIV